MKIRNDFVSNSSSTSFIVYLAEEGIEGYLNKFDELLKETINSDKLFDYAIVNHEGAKGELLDIINECADNYINGDDYNVLSYDHGLKIDLTKQTVVNVSDLLYNYMMYPQYQEEIKSRCVMFVSETCHEEGYDHGDYFNELQQYLADNNINYKTQTAHV